LAGQDTGQALVIGCEASFCLFTKAKAVNTAAAVTALGITVLSVVGKVFF